MKHLPTLPAAACPGDALDHIDAQALVMDLDAFERNLATMQAAATAAGVALRPYAKAHKSVCVDHVQQVEDLASATAVAGTALPGLGARLAWIFHE